MDADGALIDGKRIVTRHDYKPGVTSIWISMSTPNQLNLCEKQDLGTEDVPFYRIH
jgi:hypothetical protein